MLRQRNLIRKEKVKIRCGLFYLTLSEAYMIVQVTFYDQIYDCLPTSSKHLSIQWKLFDEHNLGTCLLKSDFDG